MEKKAYLLNAFSIQMLSYFPCNAQFIKIGKSEIDFNNVESAIGHADTANVLGVPMNRISVQLNKGDVAYFAQLVGGRLPEGCTELPKGFKFEFYKVVLS